MPEGPPNWGALLVAVDPLDHVDEGVTVLVADRYEVQADEGVADEAKRVLAAMPGRS